MIRIISLYALFILLLQVSVSNAQSIGLSDKISAGGNVWASFGNPTEVYIAPILSYKLTSTVLLGVTTFYRYRQFNRGNLKIALNDYGGGPFLRKYFLEQFYVHGEYEYQNYESFIVTSSETVNYNRNFLQSALIGGGVSYPIGGGLARLSLTVLYNLTYIENGPYASPFILRVGI